MTWSEACIIRNLWQVMSQAGFTLGSLGQSFYTENERCNANSITQCQSWIWKKNSLRDLVSKIMDLQRGRMSWCLSGPDYKAAVV